MKKALLIVVFVFTFISCSSDSNADASYVPVPYELEIPPLFQSKLINPLIPADNPLTEEGVALGKRLFFDRRLSGDNSQSCASCHSPGRSFTDNRQFSIGIDGLAGTRNSMPLFNLAWNFSERFNWDGSAFAAENQALEPVINPIEMHSNWNNVASKIESDASYVTMFEQAFGSSKVDSTSITKAIAQFERILISGNSKFDQYLQGNIQLTEEELNGFNVFMDETRGDCFHCHGSDNNPLWTDNDFHNNGLDATFSDLGLGAVTGDPNDNGKFKSPSLRNLDFTAPYMHDGRFATLEEVINFYSEGLQISPTIDPLMKKANQGGVRLTPKDKADLKAFLLTLTDNDFVNNPDFRN